MQTKKQVEQIFEDTLQKQAKHCQDKSSKPIEPSNCNKDNEIYNEKSKLLLSNNKRINVRVGLSGRICGIL